MSDVRVAESYPKGVFDAVAVRAARNFKFHPKLLDGVQVDEPAHPFAFKFYIEMPRGVKRSSAKDFRNALLALRDRNLVDADMYVAKLRTRYDGQQFNLTEVARYYQFEGLLGIEKHNYVRAAEFLDRALQLGRFLDKKDIIDTLHFQMIVAFLGVSQFHNAVDYYDSWRKVSKMEISNESVQAIESLRSDGFGRGRQFDITTY